MSECEVITIDGVPRKLACLPRVSKCGDAPFPTVDDSALIPRSKWVDVAGMSDFVWHFINQGSQGSCTAAGANTLMTVIRRILSLTNVILSQAVVYGLGNNGHDSGMPIDKALSILQKTGTVPVEVVDQYDWDGSRRWPKDWREIAKSYRLLEAQDCPTFDHLVSRIQKGFPGLLGVYWGGGGGHAICATEYVNGKLGGPNTWGKNWNKGWGAHPKRSGFWQLSESDVASGIRNFGAWSGRVVTDPIGDGDIPQPS